MTVYCIYVTGGAILDIIFGSHMCIYTSYTGCYTSYINTLVVILDTLGIRVVTLSTDTLVSYTLCPVP